MRFSRPRTVLGLILIGFIVVALPLILAVHHASRYVDRSLESQRQITRTALTALDATKLIQTSTEMERRVRQYAAIGDRELLGLYDDKREEFTSLIDDIRGRDSENLLTEQLNELAHAGAEVSHFLRTVDREAEEFGAEVDHLAMKLRGSAEGVWAQTGHFIHIENDLLQDTADRARKLLFWQSAGLIPVTVLLAVLFTTLIARPIRQIGQAIHRLGKGNLTESIGVSGPPELNTLGEELDWLRRRLIALEQEKNTFLRQMSHELKTPLASIREGTDLLGDGTAGALNNTQEEIVEILGDSARELEQLIQNLLSFSAWQQSKAQLNVGEFDLGGLLESTLDKHRLEIFRKKLRISTSSEKVVLNADREKIRMALDNLISNAIKYSPPDGVVHIGAKAQAGRIMIDVGDAGPGIPEDERERIFEPFFQGRVATGAAVRGTGIGLSVVRECINAHSGRIELVDGVYSGAHFRVSLPLQYRGKAA